MGWQTNSIMEWWDSRVNAWVKISDHGRSPLSIDQERNEKKQRMADGTLRIYLVSSKRTFTCSWENLPSEATSFLANGQSGKWMEGFYNAQRGSFKIRLRAGKDRNNTTGTGLEEVTVVLTDFSKEVSKRGPAFDLWNIDVTLEEV